MTNYRIINLEDGHPTVSQMEQRLTAGIQLARQHKIRLVKLVHGYGSSGVGGKGRHAVRRQLEILKGRGYVKYYILGENLSIFDEATRRAMDYCAELRKDTDLERHNNGITIAVL